MDEQILRNPAEQENLRVIYGHTVEVVKAFLASRHQVTSFTLTIVSALLAVTAWMYENDLGPAIGMPLLLAPLLCFIAARFDKRNQDILYECYRRAELLDEQLGCAGLGPLAHIPVERTGRAGRATFHWLLPRAYIFLGVVLFLSAVLLIVTAPSPPSDREPNRAAMSSLRTPPV
jgi:hypothetical protein